MGKSIPLERLEGDEVVRSVSVVMGARAGNVDSEKGFGGGTSFISCRMKKNFYWFYDDSI